MAQAYAITQYNGLDYQNGFQPKWNLVSERNDQKAALKVAEVLNARTKYTHRVEVVKSVELPKFTVLRNPGFCAFLAAIAKIANIY